MRRRAATILQVVTLFIGFGVVALLLWEPRIEGRNAHSTLREIYLEDPFLAYAYVGSIPFFVATCQAYRLLGWVSSRETESSERASRAARLIRNCAYVTIGFIVVGVVILMFVGEERPPAFLLGALATLPALLIGASAAAYERALRSAVD
jgi:hypothetical protein